jgi:multicomponent Na+:H+ antiporter subunit B
MIALVDFSILALLAATAVTIVRLRSLFAAVMLMGIYSLLSASWMLILDAPDVAFTEAAVGAGISTVLMLGTLALTSPVDKESGQKRLLPLIVVVVTGAALVYGTVDMPHVGDPGAPAHGHVAPRYLQTSPTEIGVPNVVTSVLASYRGYDTLGETAVILTAGLGVLLLLRRPRRKDEAPDEEAPWSG